MLNVPVGTYLVFGDEIEPRVVMLSQRGYRLFVEGCVLCEKYPKERRSLYRQTFGDGIDTAFAAWSEEFMRVVGETYAGPHQQAVRALAAAIVLGITFEALASGGRPDGGLGVRPEVPLPVRPPSGVTLAA